MHKYIKYNNNKRVLIRGKLLLGGEIGSTYRGVNLGTFYETDYIDSTEEIANYILVPFTANLI